MSTLLQGHPDAAEMLAELFANYLPTYNNFGRRTASQARNDRQVLRKFYI